MRRPRVLVMTSTFPRWEGDATPRFVRDLALAATRGPRPWDVTILAPHHPGALVREVMGPLDVRRFRYFLPSRFERLAYDGGILPNVRASWLARVEVAPFVLAMGRAMRQLMTEVDPDLIHAHFVLPQGVVAAVCHGSTPLVVSAHGSDVLGLRDAGSAALRTATLRRARVVTANSRTMEDALGRDARATKVRRLPMGVDVAMFRPREGGGARNGSLLFVGRLSRQKGVHVLLEAITRIRRPLLVIGDGPERAALEAKARDLPVTFAGGLSEAAVAEAYRTASAVVVPSLEGEAQGLVALEAMASHTPVVVTRVGGLAEAVDGDRGWLAEPNDAASLADAIDEALTQPDEALRRCATARAWVVANRGWDAVIPQLHAIYTEATWG